MTRKELFRYICLPLGELYGECEARSIAFLVCGRLFSLSRTDLALEPEATVAFPDGFTEVDLERMTGQLAASRPVQYVLGSAPFCGLEIGVEEGVLIPRPETEELVYWVTEDFGPNASVRDIHQESVCGGSGVQDGGALPVNDTREEFHTGADGFPNGAGCTQRILDVGTGSGCIALALARLLPDAEVTGGDVSPRALEIARGNALALGLPVRFLPLDILGPSPEWTGPWDAIVSNPPYIPSSDRVRMRSNVLDYEPEGALFVPDDDPLLFYRAIARFGRRTLRDEGLLYFEIYEHLAMETARMLEEEGYGEVTLRRDIFDKPRMVRCRKS